MEATGGCVIENRETKSVSLGNFKAIAIFEEKRQVRLKRLALTFKEGLREGRTRAIAFESSTRPLEEKRSGKVGIVIESAVTRVLRAR